MTQEEKNLLTKDGMFYNTETATLIMQMKNRPSPWENIDCYYKSKTGKYFRTNVRMFLGNVDRETLIDEIDFESVRYAYDNMRRKIGAFSCGVIITHLKELTETKEV